jgi:hypothetical protein
MLVVFERFKMAVIFEMTAVVPENIFTITRAHFNQLLSNIQRGWRVAERGAAKLAAKLSLSGKILLTEWRATIRSVLKVYFLRTKTRSFWGMFVHSHTQPDPKQGMKKILRHFATTFVPTLTLQISGIVHGSLESPTHECFAYHLIYSRSRCLVTWQEEVKLCKVSDGTSSR